MVCMSDPGSNFRGFLTMSLPIVDVFFIIIITTIMIGTTLGITIKPKNVTILEGKDAEFKCFVDDTNIDRIEWLKNDKIVSEEEGGGDKAEFRLNFVNVNQSDGGNYQCRVSSQKSNVAYFNVFPKQSCYSDKTIYNVGEKMIAVCMVKNVNLNPKLVWFKCSTCKELKNTTHTNITNTFTIKEKHSSEVFRCTMTADHGRIDNDCILQSITVKINVTILAFDNLQVGHSVAFQCKTGHVCPQCEYNWTINNTSLLVNNSGPDLKLNITDEMNDCVLICHVTSSNEVHGSASFIIGVNDDEEYNKNNGNENHGNEHNGIGIFVLVTTVSFLSLLIVVIISAVLYYKGTCKVCFTHARAHFYSNDCYEDGTNNIKNNVSSFKDCGTKSVDETNNEDTHTFLSQQQECLAADSNLKMTTSTAVDIKQNGKEKQETLTEDNTDSSKEAEYQDVNYEVNIPKSQDALKVKTIASSDEDPRYNTLADRMPKANTHTFDGSKTMQAKPSRTLASGVSISGFKKMLDLRASKVDDFVYNKPFDIPSNKLPDKPPDNGCENESIKKKSLPAPLLSRSANDLASSSSLDFKQELKLSFNDCNTQLYCEISDTLRSDKNDTHNFQTDKNIDKSLTLYAYTPCTSMDNIN